MIDLVILKRVVRELFNFDQQPRCSLTSTGYNFKFISVSGLRVIRIQNPIEQNPYHSHRRTAYVLCKRIILKLASRIN